MHDKRGYTKKQLDWCRQYAPESLKSLSDGELWLEMKDVYERMHKEE